MFYVKAFKCSEGTKVLIIAEEARGAYGVHIFQMTVWSNAKSIT